MLIFKLCLTSEIHSNRSRNNRDLPYRSWTFGMENRKKVANVFSNTVHMCMMKSSSSSRWVVGYQQHWAVVFHWLKMERTTNGFLCWENAASNQPTRVYLHTVWMGDEPPAKRHDWSDRKEARHPTTDADGGRFWANVRELTISSCAHTEWRNGCGFPRGLGTKIRVLGLPCLELIS